jgi:hypothetical protein
MSAMTEQRIHTDRVDHGSPDITPLSRSIAPMDIKDFMLHDAHARGQDE